MKRDWNGQYSVKKCKTPVGELTLVAKGDALCMLLWEKKAKGRVKLPKAFSNECAPVLGMAEKQLREYFSGKRKVFDLPLAPEGTAFQKRVWKALQKIPYGKTVCYAEQAQWLGDPKLARAVGGANGKNPISIVVPCHRVIGKSGKLTGFAGGLKTKKYLLELEGSAE